ncbi:hypothetical protein SAMN05660649_03867 [Desulfotomaculum arcticum]|uniref:Uncharacterized protein n=1 Tax=Desulfotruncus arcticus DSM 17038 TaxID=1121424 RepID=A0A1I2X9H0_9FIRM|nr:hypothetical protein [Desulfotruncus arcticus]SFH10164.1 hypothetical protein SAMN05660649_03867 [Desulfotomaculum arcticum] [Desulfotruncus arcticus DSM 17038]
MTFNRRIVIGILVLVLVVGGAFLFEHVIKVQGSRKGILVPVVQNSKTIAYLDAGTIRQLGQQERELSQGQSNSNSNNEVSLSFVLGSAGIIDYQCIEVGGVGDSQDFKLSPQDIEVIALSSNSNSTFAMVNKAEGNRVMIKEVAKFNVAN